jgi:hypothetical protein
MWRKFRNWYRLYGNKDKLIVALLVLIPLSVCCIGPMAYAAFDVLRDPWIKDHMDQYITLSSDLILEKPDITGKMVIIDPDDQTVDKLHYKLPKELRARAHAEVGTVIWLQREEKKVGSYIGGGSAYQHVWTVTVIDLQSSTITGKRVFRGSEPPDTVYCKSGSVCNASGNEPASLVLDYLKSLPSRP